MRVYNASASVVAHVTPLSELFKRAAILRLGDLCERHFGASCTVEFVPPAAKGRPKESELFLTNTAKLHHAGKLYQARALIRWECNWLHTEVERTPRHVFIFSYPFCFRNPDIESRIEQTITSTFGLYDAIVAFEDGEKRGFQSELSLYTEDREMIDDCLAWLPE